MNVKSCGKIPQHSVTMAYHQIPFQCYILFSENLNKILETRINSKVPGGENLYFSKRKLILNKDTATVFKFVLEVSRSFYMAQEGGNDMEEGGTVFVADKAVSCQLDDAGIDTTVVNSAMDAISDHFQEIMGGGARWGQKSTLPSMMKPSGAAILLKM